MSIIKIMLSDSFRKNGRYCFWDVLLGLIFVRTHRFVITMRLCQAAQLNWFGRIVAPLLRVMHKMACYFACVDFPWRTEVGPGFVITHGRGIVINERASLGSNVTLFHGVTIGQADKISEDGGRETSYPVLENDVWVGPNAVIVGGVTIGEGSRICAGAFVTTDIPPRSLVVGNPAAVVKSGISPDVFNKCRLL